MSILGTTFIKKFEAYCPPALAEAGDPVGLHVGTLAKPIAKIMFTLDVRPEVVAEAISEQVDLIIAKHPPIFRPIERLTLSSPQNKMYAELLKHDIAVYAAHTNMDIIENGLNDWFCEELGIQESTYLTQTHEIPYLKLAVYVPATDAERLRDVLGKAGAGEVGPNYQACSFSSSGEGRFQPRAKAKPSLGEKGSLTLVPEVKIEMVLLETNKAAVIDALKKAHPYEEPAYAIYQLLNPGKGFGLGRVGELAKAITLEEFVQVVKQTFALDGLRLIAEDPKKLVKRIAICGGSGEKFYPAALKAKADVYLTGDVYYHTAHDMLAAGLAVIDPGHHIEVLCQRRLLELCNSWKRQYQWEVELIESKINTNPFTYY